MDKKKIRTRIAPSPTGSPHIGTAYTALFNYVFAKQNNGQFILRIEDTDRTRLVEKAEDEVIEALDWLKLIPDEGPQKDGKYQPYRQSERLEIYRKNLQILIDQKKAYWCDCSPERLEKIRKDQQANGEIPHYDRKCRYEPPKDLKNAVVRLAIPVDGETIVDDKIRGEIVFQNKILDDQILLKSDGYPTYHLASVVDDHLMEISHVIRAEEWLSSTPKHVLLYQAFGWEIPEFAHLPLLRNSDKSKISKRKNDVSLFSYREQGYLPEVLINFLALMGWSMGQDKEIFSLEEMIQKFTFDRVDAAGPVFDIQKLEWLNGHYIREMSDRKLSEYLVENSFTEYSLEQVQFVLPLVKERLKKLTEFDTLVKFFFDDVKIDKNLVVQKGKTSTETQKVLREIKSVLMEVVWKADSIEEAIKKSQEKIGWSNSDLYMTLRVATSGSKTTPPLFETLEKIGQKKVLQRLDKVIEIL